MPKRETRTLTPESATIEGAAVELLTYYCVSCGQFLLVLGSAPPLEQLPRRRTDGCFVVPDVARVVRRANVEEGECKLLRREKGAERQYRYTCPGCHLVVGYQPSGFDLCGGGGGAPSSSSSNYLYIHAGAVTRNPTFSLLFLLPTTADDGGSGVAPVDLPTACVRQVSATQVRVEASCVAVGGGGGSVGLRRVTVVDILPQRVVLQARVGAAVEAEQLVPVVVEEFLRELLQWPEDCGSVSVDRKAVTAESSSGSSSDTEYAITLTTYQSKHPKQQQQQQQQGRPNPTPLSVVGILTKLAHAVIAPNATQPPPPSQQQPTTSTSTKTSTT